MSADADMWQKRRALASRGLPVPKACMMKSFPHNVSRDETKILEQQDGTRSPAMAGRVSRIHHQEEDKANDSMGLGYCFVCKNRAFFQMNLWRDWLGLLLCMQEPRVLPDVVQQRCRIGSTAGMETRQAATENVRTSLSSRLQGRSCRVDSIM